MRRPGWSRRRPLHAKHCETVISATIENARAARGTKRVCQACETRFYDLTRSPIVCPSCGAKYTGVTAPAVALPRLGPATSKTGWRTRSMKRPSPPVPVPVEDETGPDASQDSAEEAPSAVPEDDLVLEQESDDGDVTDLIDHDVEAPKEP